MYKRITRQEEAALPKFKSHMEARQYFKDRYKGEFALASSEEIGGRVIYFYHLVFDIEEYWKGQKALLEKGYVSDQGQFMDSYQTIEIDEDGRVHIVH